jgi:O-antigen/teichoic acid export membrane protein
MTLRQTASETLDHLTQTFGFDVRFYGKSFSWLAAGQTSGIVRGVATTFLMARWLPRNIMGEFRYVLAIFALAGMFAASGVSTSIIRGIAKGDTVIVWAGIKRILMIAPLGSLLLMIAAAERYFVGETNVAIALAYSGVLFPAYAICGLYGSILTGQERIKRLTKIAIINNSLFAICFFLVIWKTKELLPVFFAYLGIDILFRGFITWNEVRQLKKSGEAISHMKLGDHLSTIGVIQALAAQLDQILIQRFAGYGILANYSVAMLIPEQIKDFMNALGGVILRRFSRHEQNGKILVQTRKHFWTVAALGGIIVGTYWLTAPIFLPWFFPQYRDQVLPSLVYSLGLLSLPSIIGLNYIQAGGNLKAIWRFYISNTVLQISSNIILIPLFGSWGAIWSKTITRLAGLPLTFPLDKIKPNTTDDTKASS